MHSLVCLRGLLGSGYPRLSICPHPMGDPKVMCFHQNSSKCTKYAKMAKNGQKTGINRLHALSGPPTLAGAARSAVFAPGIWQMRSKNRTSSRSGEGGGSKKRVQTNFTCFLTVFGYFGVFCALWFILVKTRSLLGAPLGADKWVIVGTLTPRGPTNTSSSAYVCHISCWLSKCSHGYVRPSLVAKV